MKAKADVTVIQPEPDRVLPAPPEFEPDGLGAAHEARRFLALHGVETGHLDGPLRDLTVSAWRVYVTGGSVREDRAAVERLTMQRTDAETRLAGRTKVGLPTADAEKEIAGIDRNLRRHVPLVEAAGDLSDDQISRCALMESADMMAAHALAEANRCRHARFPVPKAAARREYDTQRAAMEARQRFESGAAALQERARAVQAMKIKFNGLVVGELSVFATRLGREAAKFVPLADVPFLYEHPEHADPKIIALHCLAERAEQHAAALGGAGQIMAAFFGAAGDADEIILGRGAMAI